MATVKEMYDRLKSKGLNDYAVSGILGNVDKESGCISNNLQNTFNTSLKMTDAEYTAKVDNGTYKNFADDRAGYGLCQWTFPTRKKNLLEFCKKQGTSIGDAMMQVDFMWEEMQDAYYKTMMNILLNAKSVKEASDAFLQYYEVPANWQSKSAERAAAGQKFYDLYATKTSTGNNGGTNVSNFTPRLTAPSTTDKHWIHSSKGGLNECILISGNSCIPNCVGYAWGRVYEIIGKRPTVSRRNAEDWYGYTADGCQRSKTPTLGAVVCWAKGKVGDGSDGAGHVAIVEEIKANGDIVTSNSGYNSTRFWTQTFTKASGYGMNGYTFQGFIIPQGIPAAQPAPSTGATSGTTASGNNKTVNYLVRVKISDLYIRTGPSNLVANKGFIPIGTYTIVEEADGPGATKWGKLKSGAGWISLDFVQKV